MNDSLNAEVIPFETNASDFEQNVILGDSVFFLRMKYNIRDESWYLSIFDREERPVILSRRLIVSPFVDILENSDEDIRPQGVLIVSSTDPESDLITRDNLNDKIQLMFISDDNLLS